MLTERTVAPLPHGHLGIDVLIDGGIRVVGSIPLRLEATLPGSARYTYSKLKPIHRLEAWLDLMAMQAQDPTRSWRSISVARAEKAKGEADVVDLVSPHGPEERG